MTFGVCYHATKSILDELETIEFSLGQSKIKRVAVIQLRMALVSCYFTESGNLIVIGQVSDLVMSAKKKR